MKYFRKDWILFQEVANEGGKYPEELIELRNKHEDPETNKHVPFIKKTADGYEVLVGKNELHATSADHHTTFIELDVDGVYIYRQMIKIGGESKAVFKVPHGQKVIARAFCNLHGLWVSE